MADTGRSARPVIIHARMATAPTRDGTAKNSALSTRPTVRLIGSSELATLSTSSPWGVGTFTLLTTYCLSSMRDGRALLNSGMASPVITWRMRSKMFDDGATVADPGPLA